MPHDIFISHSTQDRAVADRMCSELEANGLSCWIAPRDISPGEAWDEAIMNGLKKCRMVLLVFSQISSESPHVKKECLKTLEMKKSLLPVRIEDVPVGELLEYTLAGIQWFNAFPPPVESHLPELTKTVARLLEQALPQAQKLPEPIPNPGPAKPQIVLLYNRNAQPDDYVLQMLESGFQEAGYEVFIDRDKFNMARAREIERILQSAEAVVPILSQSSIVNEMLEWEMKTACCAAESNHGKPRLLPVRVSYEGSLDATLDAVLNPLECALWKSQSDDGVVVKQLLEMLKGKENRKAEPLRDLDPADPRFYILRPSDEALAQALRCKDMIVLVKGGRQMGKTSLVARGLKQARATGATVVYADMQKLDSSNLANIQQFYFALGRMLALQLDIEVDIEDTWKDRWAPSVNFEQYLKKQVLTRASGHFFLALDEVDRLFTTAYGSDVFGLFRSWHNERAGDPDTPLKNLTLIISYATEAHLFIADPNQSPFNVGTKLELRDFNMEQDEALNKLYGSPLFSGDELTRFYELLNGQPYLVTRGLYQLATTHMPFEEFAATACRDEGPFGDHLRRILVMLARDAKMVEAVRAVLDGSNSLTMEAFYRLRAAGIVVGEGAWNAKMRCLLYANYLKGALRQSA